LSALLIHTTYFGAGSFLYDSYLLRSKSVN